MESTQTQPVFIDSVINEIFTEQCSFDDGGCEWQDLEQFWGEQKHRLQVVDGQVKPLSSSFEEHFLHDNFLNEPQRKNSSENDELRNKIVGGDDISDVPTVYTVTGFKPQELIAIGTYVDKEIIPGFQYKVRKNTTEEYLFKGKAKYLESIGLGYGKRITFEGDTLNENENYFWSDSSVDGYGFTLQTISNGDTFNIVDTKIGHVIGRIVINNPSLTENFILSTTIGERGYVEREVEVKFNCDVVLHDGSSKQNLFVNDEPVRGKAVIVRESWSSKATVSHIFLDDFMVESCLLMPEE